MSWANLAWLIDVERFKFCLLRSFEVKESLLEGLFRSPSSVVSMIPCRVAKR